MPLNSDQQIIGTKYSKRPDFFLASYSPSKSSSPYTGLSYTLHTHCGQGESPKTRREDPQAPASEGPDRNQPGLDG